MTTIAYRVIYSDDARDHLWDIEYYIIEAGEPQRANDFVARIRQRCESLGTFPLRHRRRDDINNGLHVTGMEGKVTITYKVNERAKLVTIAGVYYGGVNWEAQP